MQNMISFMLKKLHKTQLRLSPSLRPLQVVGGRAPKADTTGYLKGRQFVLEGG